MKRADVFGRRALLVCAACLTMGLPAVAHAAPGDPWEPANRAFYSVYRLLDTVVFSKVAAAFKLIPEPIRHAARNVIANLGEPGVAANDLLQGHPELTARTLARLAVNTTVGVAGVFDVATMVKLPHHDNTFADTFGRWGAPPGPYLFIPFVGPSTLRDELGAVADTLTDPFTWSRFHDRWTAMDARTIVGGLDLRVENDAQLKAIDNMSTDPYASLRSLYLQNRAATIASPPGVVAGDASGLPALPDFDTPAAPSSGAPPAGDGGPVPAAPPADGAPAAAPAPAPVAYVAPPPPDPDAPIRTGRYA